MVAERIKVIFENMQLTAAWLQDRFTDTQNYIEGETDALSKKIDRLEKGIFDLQVTVLSQKAKTLACVITMGGVPVRPDSLDITGFTPEGASMAISNFEQKQMGSNALMIALPKETKMSVFVVTAGLTDKDTGDDLQKQVLVSFYATSALGDEEWDDEEFPGNTVAVPSNGPNPKEDQGTLETDDTEMVGANGEQDNVDDSTPDHGKNDTNTANDKPNTEPGQGTSATVSGKISDANGGGGNVGDDFALDDDY